jgi:ERCC4-type nuclease
MRLIIDNREHDLIPICENMIASDPNYVTIEVQALPLGDILVKTDEGKDVMIVERKSLQDLLASIKDGRYEEQSHRLKHASGFPPHNVLYIIEGMYSSLRTVLEKRLVISTIASLNYFKGFSVIRTSSIYETAETMIYMANKIDRNFMKGVLPSYLQPAHAVNTFVKDESSAKDDGPNEPSEKSYSGFVKKIKKENITPENMGEIMLCQIPGISTLYAQAILKSFGGFSNLIEKVKDGSANFDNIVYDQKGKQRRIPKTCGEEIKRLLI